MKRYQRREPVINEALKQVFLLGVSTRQVGCALATLVEDAVSASTVSAVAKAWINRCMRFIGAACLITTAICF
ncbi:MAG: transposase [Verrucomicrobiota bacterium]